MRLHIFNPEHDIALAANQARFTAPHAGRQMRADLGFIPALWADDGDLVLVDDVEAAMEAVRHVQKYAHDVVFITLADLKVLASTFGDDFKIEPWGWDCTIKEQLVRVDEAFCRFTPTDVVLDEIRRLSSRQFAAISLLPRLCEIGGERVVGESRYCESMDEALAAMAAYGNSVLKSPWSSSGRGVRYVQTAEPDEHTQGWMRNIIKQQGGLMVEPLFVKVYDFGMEFGVAVDGNVEYRGLSLFNTRGGAYTGSICATEKDKREILARFVDINLIDSICQAIQQTLQPIMENVYNGVFGVDMMVVAKEGAEGFLLHPCVEMNLRRTMGHVALALSPTEFEAQRLMSIYYTDKYRVRVQSTTDNLLNTGLC